MSHWMKADFAVQYASDNDPYYEGDKNPDSLSDFAVPKRPDPTYQWNGTDWVQCVALVTAAAGMATQMQIDALGSAGSDASMSRGLEDLIGLLIAKGTIAKTDIPSALLGKINNRRTTRGQAAL